MHEFQLDRAARLQPPVAQQAAVHRAAGEVQGAGLAVGATAAPAAAERVLQVRRSRTPLGQLPIEAVTKKTEGLFAQSGLNSGNGTIFCIHRKNSILFLLH
jgi:hypothetical protein